MKTIVDKKTIDWPIQEEVAQKTTGKGKILMVKHGYNPNSSSIGSIIYAFPKLALGLTVIFGLVSSVIISKFNKSKSIHPTDKSLKENENA